MARALVAMNDDDVRAAVEGGDFSLLGDVTLSEHEKDLLSGAAEEWPEVAGFSFSWDLGESSSGDVLSWSWGVSTSTTSLDRASPTLFAACSYAGANPSHIGI